MKRLLLVLVLVLAPITLSAQSVAADHDVLLTPDGTLYTIDSDTRESYPDLNIAAMQVLTLSVQTDKSVTKTIVPESMNYGSHRRPALAYDSESNTLFVFWLHAPNAMSSELLVASYQNGKWHEATSIYDRPMTYLFNLRISVTHRVAERQKDGGLADMPVAVVHTVWWEVNGSGEFARYAMLPVDHGRIVLSDVKEQIHNLTDFVDVQATANPVSEKFNREVLRHPAILDGPLSDSVDVIFGDVTTNTFNRTTLRPIIAEGRLHIPTGVRPGGPTSRIPAPSNFTSDWNGSRIDTIGGRGTDSGRIVLYNVTDTTVDYLQFTNGKWSQVTSLPITAKVSADAAVAAVNRMITTNE
jgi:hypothetical protein